MPKTKTTPPKKPKKAVLKPVEATLVSPPCVDTPQNEKVSTAMVLAAPQKQEVIPVTSEEALRNILKFIHNNQVQNLFELAEKTNIPIETIAVAGEYSELDFVKISQFKEMFPISLELNIRKLTIIISEMTDAAISKDKIKRHECDPFKLQKYCQALKTLRDVLLSTGNYSPAANSGDLAGRHTIKAYQVTEEIYEIFRKKKIN